MIDFNPRAPRGARHDTVRALTFAALFQSTRPSRGATLSSRHDIMRMIISIHAPLAGRDGKDKFSDFQRGISIHAPLAGRDRSFDGRARHRRDFNPRAPRGARQPMANRRNSQNAFQSTRPSRGATVAAALVEHGDHISIHAPLAGRDTRLRQFAARVRHFNPRAPRGARLRRHDLARLRVAFQSTRPSRGATNKMKVAVQNLTISIHAPLAGRDSRKRVWKASTANFNPRAPRGARRVHGRTQGIYSRFQSTRPSRGATWLTREGIRCFSNFNPRAPRGARPPRPVLLVHEPIFQSTRPSWGATESSCPLLISSEFQSTRPSWGATVPSLFPSNLL